MKAKGIVYIVGAGPGDSELLTLRGAGLLARADVVAAESEIAPDLLRHAAATAEIIHAPKTNGASAASRAEWSTQLIARAHDGKTVVWLKTGAPNLTENGGEITSELTAAHVPFEVVPGISILPAVHNKTASAHSLQGQRIVVTRAREQADKLSQQLRDRGAQILEIPTIQIKAPTDHQCLVDAMLELNAYDWIVFTSPNGVVSFFEHFFKAFEDLRDIGGVRIAAVGPGTAAKLKELHLKVDLMPKDALAKNVAKEMAAYESLDNLKILLLRAEKATHELPELLDAMSAIVDDVACYQTVAETEDRTGAAARFLNTGADWITFTSASTVEHFHARFDLPAILTKFPGIKIASIGPETTKAITVLGLKPTVEAKEHTIEGLVKSLEKS